MADPLDMSQTAVGQGLFTPTSGRSSSGLASAVAQAVKAPTTINPEVASQAQPELFANNTSASPTASATVPAPATPTTGSSAAAPKPVATTPQPSAAAPAATTGNGVMTGGTSTAGPFQQKDQLFKPIVSQVDKPTETVQGQLKNILDESNPLMVAARNRGTAMAAGRGLQNSSLAAGASQLSMINSAMPIAQQDAATYSQRAMQNAQNAQEFAVAQMAYYQELGKLKEQGNINAYLTTLQAGFDKELEHIRGGYALAVENVRGANELVAIAKKGDIESKLQMEKYGFDSKLSGQENLQRLEQLAAQGDINAKLQLDQFNYDSLLKDKDKDIALALEDKRFQSNQNLVLIEYEQKGVLSKQEADDAMARLNQQHVNTLAEIDKNLTGQAAITARNNYLTAVAARQASGSAEITQIYTTPKLSKAQQQAGVTNAYARMDADIAALGKYYGETWGDGPPENP